MSVLEYANTNSKNILDSVGPRALECIRITSFNQEYRAYRVISDMHGSKIKVFKQTGYKEDHTGFKVHYEYFGVGRCIGDRVFFIKEKKQLIINLDSFQYLFFPDFENRIDSLELNMAIS